MFEAKDIMGAGAWSTTYLQLSAFLTLLSAYSQPPISPVLALPVAASRDDCVQQLHGFFSALTRYHRLPTRRPLKTALGELCLVMVFLIQFAGAWLVLCAWRVSVSANH